MRRTKTPQIRDQYSTVFARNAIAKGIKFAHVMREIVKQQNGFTRIGAGLLICNSQYRMFRNANISCHDLLFPCALSTNSHACTYLMLNVNEPLVPNKYRICLNGFPPCGCWVALRLTDAGSRELDPA